MSCYDCGLEYDSDAWIEAIIPDKVWCDISPTGDESGILCISCIACRLMEKEYINYTRIPVWLCGTEPLFAMMGNPGDPHQIDLLRNWYPEIPRWKREEE